VLLIDCRVWRSVVVGVSLSAFLTNWIGRNWPKDAFDPVTVEARPAVTAIEVWRLLVSPSFGAVVVSWRCCIATARGQSASFSHRLFAPLNASTPNKIEDPLSRYCSISVPSINKSSYTHLLLFLPLYKLIYCVSFKEC
jgi:hypothetical protein